MNGRVYDPSIGRFLSPDVQVPFPELTQSYNRYSYVQNNPLSRVDPSGYGDKSASDKQRDKENKKCADNPSCSVVKFSSERKSGTRVFVKKGGKWYEVSGGSKAKILKAVGAVVKMSGELGEEDEHDLDKGEQPTPAVKGSSSANQPEDYGTFAWAKRQLGERGLIPEGVLNDPKKLVDLTNQAAVFNGATGKLKKGLTMKKARALVASGKWEHVEGSHQGGVMKIYMAATLPVREKHLGMRGRDLTGPQNLVQTIYHEYMHYSGFKGHGDTPGLLNFTRWSRREEKVLGGWINGL